MDAMDAMDEMDAMEVIDQIELSDQQKEIRKEILQYSYAHDLGHIPSAFSCVDYLQSVFLHVHEQDYILIGKPFGAQALYIVWKRKGWLRDIDSLSLGVKHDEIPFVHYSEETIGNALGVAGGVALSIRMDSKDAKGSVSPDSSVSPETSRGVPPKDQPCSRRVYVNISDAAFQMGNTLEAIQFIAHHQLRVFCTVDYNNAQVLGTCKDILNVEPVIAFAKLCGWEVMVVQGHNKQHLDQAMAQAYACLKPCMVICCTVKGAGINSFMDIKTWHYRKLDEKSFTQFITELS